MKKAFDQTVRDIKREVNKKVLKVPSIEQKVLDATSNEPWGPHGTVLADIAQASRNYHEYQMIMAVIWKRINDTGKNWRHVYKALTVLEYMVANGSDRVIDDIREHAYQIQTLSDFQYIDSSGRDQGNNVRKKSQSLVVLVNDKERIAEVRQKAAANRDKYRGSHSGSMYRPGSGGFEDERYDGRYGSRDDDRNGYGRERDYGQRDDDRYGRYGDSYGRDGDRYGRDHEDRNGRDGYKDDDYRGRSRSVDAHQYGSRSRSSDRDRDHSYEEDGQNGSSNLDKRLERKFSEQNIGAPPSYEEAVGAALSPTYSEPGGEIPSASAPTSYSSPANASPKQGVHRSASQPAFTSPPSTASPPPPPPPASEQKEPDSFDEFDPRGSFSGAPVASSISAQNSSSAAEVDLLGSLSESFSADSLALVPADSSTSAPGTGTFGETAPGATFVAPVSSSLSTQSFDDPFGDGPFKAMPSADNTPAQPQNNMATSYPASSNQMLTPSQMVTQSQESFNNTGDTFAAYPLSNASGTQASRSNVQYSHQELSTPNNDFDILADILPPTAPQAKDPYSQTGFPQQNNQNVPQTVTPSQTGQVAPQSGFQHGSGQALSTDNFSVQAGQTFLPQGFSSGQHVPQTNFYPQNAQRASPSFTAPAGQVLQSGFPSQSGQPASIPGFPFQTVSAPHSSFQPQSMQQNVPFSGNYNPQTRSSGFVAPQVGSQVSAGPPVQPGSMGFLSQSGSVSSASSQIPPLQSQKSAPVISQALVPVAPQPADDKFKTKSTVWTDTLNRGLVNLNISGPKINPLADIGVDFDAINRREKRMEKPTTAPVVSTVNMGKAMGSGTGLGRAGAGVLRPPSNPMVGSGMGPGAGYGAGMGAGPRPPMGMGGYGAVNQPMGGIGMSPNMGMGMGMGMGMNMGIGQGGQMQQPMGFPPGSAMPGGYNPMTGTGNYGQQPYGGGHRWSST